MATEKKEKNIQIRVALDKDKRPATIHWQADDNPQGEREAKAFMLSLFDEESKDTLKIDLWTTEMKVMEMDRFVFQTLRGISDTYYKATQNAEMASQMQNFVQYFGEKTGIIPPAEGGKGA